MRILIVWLVVAAIWQAVLLALRHFGELDVFWFVASEIVWLVGSVASGLFCYLASLDWRQAALGQINAKLRSTERHHFSHWCPGCGEMHGVPRSWTFDGNYDAPTVTPSVRITGKQTVKDALGRWTGEWVRGPDGKALDFCCHYILTAGQLNFCSDCTHALAGRSVPLPDLPEGLTDEDA